MLGLSALEEAVVEAAATDATPDLGGEVPQGVFLPATRTHGFFAGRRADGTAASELVDADAGDLTALLKRFWPTVGPTSAPALAVIGRWPLLHDKLAALGYPLREQTPSTMSQLAIHGMSRKGAGLWPHGFGEQTPEPRYLRLSTAEERLQQLAAQRPV